MDAYSADDGSTSPTLRHLVPRTLARLAAVVAGTRRVLHVEPVARPRPVAQRLLGIDGEVFVGAVQRRLDQHAAVLQQAGADLATGAGQVVERVEVDVCGDGHDDTGESQSVSPAPQPSLQPERGGKLSEWIDC